MLKKLSQASLALLFACGLVLSSIQPADAGRGGRVAAGVAAGIIGLGLLGAYANAREHDYEYEGRACYPGPERCAWRDRRCFENAYGDEVCRGGRYSCWREEICE